MYDTSLKTRSYVALGVMFLGFAMMYPVIIQPIILRLFGFKTSSPDTFDPTSERPPLNSRLAEIKQQKTSRSKSGVLQAVLPIYALGIVLYFAYILYKLFPSRNQEGLSKKDKCLKDYYRNFRYNVEKGRFIMDSETSDEDGMFLKDSLRSKIHRKRLKSGTNGTFDWSRAYGDDASFGHIPDIYRSTKSLPRDLEYLLKKIDDNNLDDEEVHRLRIRLDEVEHEMTRLLHAINENSFPTAPSYGETSKHYAHKYNNESLRHNGDSENQSSDEDLFSANEDELGG